jgi:hypothetical protein
MTMSRYGTMSSRLISVPWPGTMIVLASADLMVASSPSIMPLSEPPLDAGGKCRRGDGRRQEP